MRAFVQEDGGARLGVEEWKLVERLGALGIPVELFTRKQIDRRRLPLDRGSLVAGDVPSVHGALAQLGVERPRTNDYPSCLRHLLHRRLWSSTVRRLKEDLFEGAAPVFAKPAGGLKRFTGRVFACPDDLDSLEGASSTTAVHYAEPVCWASESRVYVVRGQVVGIRHYSGDPAVQPAEALVAEAVRSLRRSGEATAGYGLDLGVLEDGRTAPVEWNDGYSLGAYGLDAASYTDLILARWAELVG